MELTAKEFFGAKYGLLYTFESLCDCAFTEIDSSLIFRSNDSIVGVSLPGYPYLFYCSKKSDDFFIKFKHLPKSISFECEDTELLFTLLKECAEYYYSGNIRPISKKHGDRKDAKKHRAKKQLIKQEVQSDLDLPTSTVQYQRLYKTAKLINAYDFVWHREHVKRLYLSDETEYFLRDMREYFAFDSHVFCYQEVELENEIEDFLAYEASILYREQYRFPAYYDHAYISPGDEVYFIGTKSRQIETGVCKSYEFPHFILEFGGRCYKRSIFSVGSSFFLTRQGAQHNLEKLEMLLMKG